MSSRRVLLVVFDQLRADCVFGALGGIAIIPNFRRLMEEGASFTSHFTVAVPCGPARASMLTGRYAMNHRSVRNGTPLAAGMPNLAQAVKGAGLRPLLFGYTDTSPDPRGRDPSDPELRSYEGTLPGFEEALSLRAGDNSNWFDHLERRGYGRFCSWTEAARTRGGGIQDPVAYRAEDSESAFLTDGLTKRLDASEPWLALAAYIRPHPPLAAPEPYNRLHDSEDLPPPDAPESIEQVRSRHPIYAAHFDGRVVTDLYAGFDGKIGNLTDSQTAALRAVYLGLVSEADAQLGRLLDHLAATGMDKDTLVVVTSDHGEMLGDQRLWGKGSPNDGAWHVPLIIRDPHRLRSAGRTVDAFTESVDLMPTALEWLGAEMPDGLDGRSLLPWLEDGASCWRDMIIGEMDLGNPVEPTVYQRSLGLGLDDANAAILRERRFKYVHFNGGVPPLLFDLQADPGEHRNLAADPAHSGEMSRLRGRMLDHRMRHADRTLTHLAITPNGVQRARPESPLQTVK